MEPEAENDELTPIEVMRFARDELEALTGMHVENVSRLQPSEDGWVVEIQVLELERIPDTMSLLSSYEVTVDGNGKLTAYRQLGRYERGKAGPARGGA